MKKVKVGIIGIGNMGSSHYKNILLGKAPELTVAAIADINPARLEWAQKTHAEIKAENPDLEDVAYFSDASEMIASGKAEAIVVAIPHYDHPRYSIEALEHGLHVMCEKPAGVYTEQVREMMAVADQHPDQVFAMMFNQRTNHVYRKMHEIIKSGELGEIRRTNWIITTWYRSQRYYDSGAWRATWAGEGGGVLLNQCPHNLDLWQWICGMPSKVDAKLHYGKWHDIEVEDDVTAYVEYPNGATGVFVTTTGDAPGTNRFEVTCDKGKIVCENNTLTVWKLDTPLSEFSKGTEAKGFGQPKNEKIVVETDGKNEQHMGVFKAWAAAILRGEPLVADGREGVNGLTISNAMHLSSWLGKEIEIPFDEALFKEELMKRVATSKLKTDTKAEVADTTGSY